MLILHSRYRGIVAIQGNYPQKCCHSAMSKLCYAQAHHIEHRELPIKSAAAEIIKIKLALTKISLCYHLVETGVRIRKRE